HLPRRDQRGEVLVHLADLPHPAPRCGYTATASLRYTPAVADGARVEKDLTRRRDGIEWQGVNGGGRRRISRPGFFHREGAKDAKFRKLFSKSSRAPAPEIAPA